MMTRWTMTPQACGEWGLTSGGCSHLAGIPGTEGCSVLQSWAAQVWQCSAMPMSPPCI